MNRHLTVAVFVVHQNKTLLHLHKKLGSWLPVGGHVDPNESPCEAAIRETQEEAGLTVELYRHLPVVAKDDAHIRTLISPIHIQNEHIDDGHEHIDCIFYARSSTFDLKPDEGEQAIQIGWYTKEELNTLPLMDDVKAYALEALELLSR